MNASMVTRASSGLFWNLPNDRKDRVHWNPTVKGFKKSFTPQKESFAADLLHLGRESYRLRDDGNIHLVRLEARLVEAVAEGQVRLSDSSLTRAERTQLLDIPSLGLMPESKSVDPVLPDQASESWLKSRQIVGHPAGPGIAREYGLPCITGTSQAMQGIENGNQITVDGYPGIVTCRTDAL